ncbi:MAG: LLM class F420-dependent oxidoreductase [Candidatus Dormibacteria bacterium]
MELHIFTEPQNGASYEQLSAFAQASEALGFAGFFRSDHYLSIHDASGLPGPTDAWATLAALALETKRIRLGTLMTCATFRLPGPLAITVAQVDQMSQGRVELGLGAGWYAAEHSAYGIPFPSPKERFERLAEQLEIISGLWAASEGSLYSFRGRHYQLQGAPGLPKPRQRPGPPILVGGMGRRRTPELAARYATEFNIAFRPISEARPQFQRVRQACEARGRDPGDLRLSVALTACCGRTEVEVGDRARRIGQDLAGLARSGAAGTPGQVRDQLRDFAELGCSRIYLQMLDLGDHDHLELLAQELLPAFA